jgi:hypothetical protein
MRGIKLQEQLTCGEMILSERGEIHGTIDDFNFWCLYFRTAFIPWSKNLFYSSNAFSFCVIALVEAPSQDTRQQRYFSCRLLQSCLSLTSGDPIYREHSLASNLQVRFLKVT